MEATNEKDKKTKDSFYQDAENAIKELTYNESYLIQELYDQGSHKAKEKDKYSCVFCNSRDNMGVYKSKEGKCMYKCFGCGESGDIINLVKNKENIDFYSSLKKLSSKHGIILSDKNEIKVSRAIKNKVVDFYEKKSEEALKKGDFDEAFKNSCEADRQKENNYYVNFPFLDLKNNPLIIWENVEAILQKEKIKPVYNSMSKEIEILNSNAKTYNNQVMDLHSLCRKHGLKVTIDFLLKSIDRVSEENVYNPITEYLELCEFNWDEQTGRIKELCECLMVQDFFSEQLRNKLVTKWLLNTVNIAYNQGYSNIEGCLVLQGPQGCGKTTFIKKLVPPQFLKTGLDLDPSSTDSVRKCIKYWVVELGELDATMKSDQAKLKAFITESIDEYRVPYAISPKRYNRTTSFYGTVNKANFLKDETGDRRYWVIPVKDIDIDRMNNIDMEQLWGEVMNLLPSNLNNLNLNKEELKELSNSNEEFRVKGSTQIVVESSFDWNSNKDLWSFKPTSDIASSLNLKSTAGLKEALEGMGAESKRVRINGKQCRGYLVPKYKFAL